MSRLGAFFRKKNPRRILFLVIVLFVFFVAVEGAFRVYRIYTDKFPSSPIVFQQIPDPFFLTGERPGELRPAVGSLSNNSFHPQKPEKTFQVFCLGGSATKGLGFPYHGAFSYWLERMLALSYPDRKFEVVNVGGVGFGSTQVKYVLQEIFKTAKPDLIVVYSGNNEFLDFKALRALRGEMEKNYPQGSLKRFLADHTALFHFLDIRRKEWRREIDANPTLFSDYKYAWLLPEQVEQVFDRYEKNLRAMAAEARRNNTPLVLATLIADPFSNPAVPLFASEDIEAPEKLLALRQAVGWARLGHWEKSLESLKPLQSIGARVNLLRIFEAGGIRGIADLSPEARADLENTARSLLPFLESVEYPEQHDQYALAICYRLLGMEDKLGAFLKSIENGAVGPAEDSKGQQNVLFAQFADAETYSRAYLINWRNAPAGVTAFPRTSHIVRRVAGTERVILADVLNEVPNFIEPSPRRYLLDYCHFNIEGAFEAARVMFEAARDAGALPPNPAPHDFRKEMLAPDLAWLREKGHDFLDPKRWMGMYFRVCGCYSEPDPATNVYLKWFQEDARRLGDPPVAEEFRRIARIAASE